MSDALRGFVDEAILALAPLVDAAGDPAALAALLDELGWTPASMPKPLSDLAVAGAQLIDFASADDSQPAVALEQAFGAIQRLVAAIDAIRSQPDSVFPGGIDVAAFKATIGRDLLDHLLAE